MYTAACHTIFDSSATHKHEIKGGFQFTYRFCPNTQSRCGQTCIPNQELGGALESPSLDTDREALLFIKEVSTRTVGNVIWWVFFFISKVALQ